jgi:hypothetical protein
MTKNFKVGEIVKIKPDSHQVFLNGKICKIEKISKTRDPFLHALPPIDIIFFFGKKPYYKKRFSVVFKKELTDATENEKKDFLEMEADWESINVARKL